MKQAASPSSFSKSGAAASAMEDRSPESRNCGYIPWCRRDAQCNCDVCLASFNATLDLMPPSAQASTITRFPSSTRAGRNPIDFDSSFLSTPGSPSRFGFNGKAKKAKDGGGRGLGFTLLNLALGVCLVFAAEIGLRSGVSRVFAPKLTADVVRRAGERFQPVQDFGRLQNEFRGLVLQGFANCSGGDGGWAVNQDGLLLSSRCALYKSATEEVSIWGWPLPAAGLLVTEFSSRSFTVLSGRVTEWPSGEFMCLLRKVNNSWTQGKWRSSVVRLDPNTWILEYRRSWVLEGPSLFSSVAECLKFWGSRLVAKARQQLWQINAPCEHPCSVCVAPNHNFCSPT